MGDVDHITGLVAPLMPASHPAGPSAPLLTLSLCLIHPHPSSVKPLSLSSSLLGAIDLLPLNYTPASPRPIPRVCVTCPPTLPRMIPRCHKTSQSSSSFFQPTPLPVLPTSGNGHAIYPVPKSEVWACPQPSPPSLPIPKPWS